MYLLIRLQPKDISLRCRKPTVVIQAFIFRRKASRALRERKTTPSFLSGQIRAIIHGERNVPGISLSYSNSIAPNPLIVLALRVYCLVFQVWLAQKWPECNPRIPSPSPLPSSPLCSLHSGWTGFLATHTKHAPNSSCYLCDFFLNLNIITLDICMVSAKCDLIKVAFPDHLLQNSSTYLPLPPSPLSCFICLQIIYHHKLYNSGLFLAFFHLNVNSMKAGPLSTLFLPSLPKLE